MSAPNWKSAPTPLKEVPVHPDHSAQRGKGSLGETYQQKYLTNHGLITRRQEEAYLSTKAGLDVQGNNAKESETFFLKSQFGVRARGSRRTVDNLLGYITVHMLQQPMMMIEAKRHPKRREHMTPAEITALENQVEKYCRKWLTDNPHIPFLYAVTCASTEMRFWMMERKRDMERAKMVGLWEPDKRTWDEYRDPGLDCDADIISAAINLIKDHPNGSDFALTTTSDSQSQSDRAPSAVPSRATGGTSGSRRGTPSGDSRGDRTRSRDRRDNRSDDQPSSQEETPEERSERRKRKERAKESEKRNEDEGKGKGKGKETRRSERGDREKDRGERRETSDKSRSLLPSAPIDVSRSTSRGDPRRPNTSIDERGRLASSSSPEYPAQIPIRDRDRRERGDTDRGERVSTKDGKIVEASSSSKTTESRKRDFQARRTDSLSTVPPTSSDDLHSSSSDNRAPRSKSKKRAEGTTADAGRKKRDKPSGSG
ncbi:uncharacterized protein EAF02_003382 [Botrytis sinoallii]|uniref:uncharacterized protein n=1 Tax=Botrytis sinoallii TaxID=1463999 RepID=UPI001900B9F7|nr:uncharacterized protein EAF02_003382 [Botrytis sinoallii]KAF7886735.1 hypothetical protein EAF02_003382 [Botrytis sinoallii]